VIQGSDKKGAVVAKNVETQSYEALRGLSLGS
jgi:hypothetical protein